MIAWRGAERKGSAALVLAGKPCPCRQTVVASGVVSTEEEQRDTRAEVWGFSQPFSVALFFILQRPYCLPFSLQRIPTQPHAHPCAMALRLARVFLSASRGAAPSSSSAAAASAAAVPISKQPPAKRAVAALKGVDSAEGVRSVAVAFAKTNVRMGREESAPFSHPSPSPPPSSSSSSSLAGRNTPALTSAATHHYAPSASPVAVWPRELRQRRHRPPGGAGREGRPRALQRHPRRLPRAQHVSAAGGQAGPGGALRARGRSRGSGRAPRVPHRTLRPTCL